MTLCYCTNIWSHHQGTVCQELAKLLGDDFKMVLFQPLACDWSQERIKMGWSLDPPSKTWIVPPPKTTDELCDGVRDEIMLSSEVAVIGISPYMNERMIKRRIDSGKPTLIMGERFFKDPRRWFDYFNLRSWRRWFGLWKILHHKNVHYLTMNHWMKDDLSFLHVCKGRTWRWAYMTPLSSTEPSVRNNDRVKIGWCGRMFDWKQTILGLQAFATLPERIRERCEFEIIGNGEMKELLVQAVRDLGIERYVSLGDMKPHKQLIDWLREIDIYLFTSNRREGWGATLIEAMDCGCAVIANREAGSTLEVVEDGISGFVFDDLDVAGLAEKLQFLIENRSARVSMGHRAWQAVKVLSPEIGAEHLVQLAESLMGVSGITPPNEGLCSLVR